jgi:hypothetical protein
MTEASGKHDHLSFYSGEARQLLRIPDSPVIHLAICIVAELLRPLESRSTLDSRGTRIMQVRTASHAALENMPIEIARQHFLMAVGVPPTGPLTPELYRGFGTNWLAQARAALVVMGLDPGMDTTGMATYYGWEPRELSPQTPRAQDG